MQHEFRFGTVHVRQGVWSKNDGIRFLGGFNDMKTEDKPALSVRTGLSSISMEGNGKGPCAKAVKGDTHQCRDARGIPLRNWRRVIDIRGSKKSLKQYIVLSSLSDLHAVLFHLYPKTESRRSFSVWRFYKYLKLVL